MRFVENRVPSGKTTKYMSTALQNTQNRSTTTDIDTNSSEQPCNNLFKNNRKPEARSWVAIKLNLACNTPSSKKLNHIFCISLAFAQHWLYRLMRRCSTRFMLRSLYVPSRFTKTPPWTPKTYPYRGRYLMASLKTYLRFPTIPCLT